MFTIAMEGNKVIVHILSLVAIKLCVGEVIGYRKAEGGGINGLSYTLLQLIKTISFMDKLLHAERMIDYYIKYQIGIDSSVHGYHYHIEV